MISHAAGFAAATRQCARVLICFFLVLPFILPPSFLLLSLFSHLPVFCHSSFPFSSPSFPAVLSFSFSCMACCRFCSGNSAMRTCGVLVCFFCSALYSTPFSTHFPFLTSSRLFPFLFPFPPVFLSFLPGRIVHFLVLYGTLAVLYKSG